RGVEGGPAAVGVELGGGREQLGAAALAGVGAGRSHLLVLPGAGALGRALAQDLELGGGEALAPFEIAHRQGVGAGSDGFGGHLRSLRSVTSSSSARTGGEPPDALVKNDGERGVHSLDPSSPLGCAV